MSGTYIRIESPYSLSPSSPERGERNLLFSSQELANLSPLRQSPSGSRSCSVQYLVTEDYNRLSSDDRRSSCESPSNSVQYLVAADFNSRSPCGSPSCSVRYIVTADCNSDTEACALSGRPVSLLINGCSDDGGRCNIGCSPTRSDYSRCSSISISTNRTNTLNNNNSETHLIPLKPPKRTILAPETYLVLALVVAFFFNLPFGLVAMCISIKSKKKFAIGESVRGERMAFISLCVSLMGIFVSAAAVVATIFLVLNKPKP